MSTSGKVEAQFDESGACRKRAFIRRGPEGTYTVLCCRITFPYVAIITDQDADHDESVLHWAVHHHRLVTFLYHINPIRTAHACGPLIPFFPVPPLLGFEALASPRLGHLLHPHPPH